ncbi:MAG: flagellar biosynthesis anti-sigma factor FlgM [Lachnospiraceae bacterium]|nr:flagellar biosynthesis anti-sigma factor FlgM [Lachnospiraceae bacterium]MCI9096084.1 flagellar biosynthesis anti-sigma factor FlgM [Lachnospiraceae bacterium]MCI9202838.1 flagellar biosynthesis anti-sigma factor FlgM [Lachnospiraceae bacterium]MCI9334245.1 flagellar biosynthesis anti-sigma factor FlgM [Lachnospiraceae bacterium]
MRIEAYTQVQKLYDTNKAKKAAVGSSVNVSDKLQLSSLGKDIQWAKKAVAESSDVREDVVAPIKARIQSGTYEVSADSFADKLIQKFEELR